MSRQNSLAAKAERRARKKAKPPQPTILSRTTAKALHYLEGHMLIRDFIDNRNLRVATNGRLAGARV